MTARDINIIRELAKQYMEVAMSDRHVRMRRRFRDTNDLKIVRPPVLIDEIPWHEMNYEGALDCVCEDDGLRGVEYELRVALYREKYFKCDNLIEPCWVVHKSYSNTGIGFEIKEDQLAVDKNNGIVSHRYYDVFEDEAVLEQYHDPVITPYPENDEKNMANMQEIFPERFFGRKHNSFTERKLVSIERDMGKCILCNLCVRTCKEEAEKGILGLVGRGFKTVIKPEFENSEVTDFCKNCKKCAEICPTGALKIIE